MPPDQPERMFMRDFFIRWLKSSLSKLIVSVDLPYNEQYKRPI